MLVVGISLVLLHYFDLDGNFLVTVVVVSHRI